MTTRLEALLSAALAPAEAGAPPKLAAALRHAVFPGGARVRPRLVLAVADATRADAVMSPLVDAMACAVELMHCASLVHDDLPCFDDADLRRGLPSVHRAFGEPTAVLAGDALIVLAFETLARAGEHEPSRALLLTTLLARASGAPYGLVAGQAWESEPRARLDDVHRAKTGSLFVAAAMGGALAAGSEPTCWRAMGERLGQAYQVADDLLDALASPSEAGKPTQRDATLARPNAVLIHGIEASVTRLRALAAEAAGSVPECPGAPLLRALVVELAERLIPAKLKQSAA